MPFSGGSSSKTTYTRCRRPRGSRLVQTSPEAIRRSRVDRDTASSRQASALEPILKIKQVKTRMSREREGTRVEAKLGE